MAFPSQDLSASGGELWSHVFENPATGLGLDHYWSLSIDFEPLDYADGPWICTAIVDWLRFPVRDWRDLAWSAGTDGLDDGLVEPSFYLVEHDRARLADLALRRVVGARFDVDLDLRVDFGGYVGDDVDPSMVVSAECTVEYRGLVIGEGAMSPRPSRRAARVLAGRFVDLGAYHEPAADGGRFVLRPRP